MWPAGSPNAVVNGASRLIIAALIIAALYSGRELLIPLALAGIMSFVLFPPVRRLTHWGVPQPVAVAIVMSGVVAGLLGSMTLAGREVAQLVEEVPRYETNLRAKALYVHSLFGGTGIWQRAIGTLRNVEQEVRDPGTESAPIKVEVAQDQPIAMLFAYTKSTLPAIVTAGLVLVVTVFILLQYGDLRDRAVRLMGGGEIGRSTQALNDAGYDLAHFLLLQAAVNASFGAVVGLALWLAGIPSPVLWGVIAAFMRFVPYVGSALAAVIPLALAAMIDSGWGMLFETAALFLLGDLAVGQFIEPMVFGAHTRLSPIAVLLSAVFWTLLWGPVGLILAVPLTLTLVVMGQHVPHLDFLRILLGNEPVLAPPEKLYRQLLAGDTAEAAKNAEDWLRKKGLVKYLDEATIPALHIASNDQRRGVLAKEQADEFSDTLAEYIAYVRELLETKDERQGVQGRTQERTRQRTPPRSDPAVPAARPVSAVIIAARGAIDQAAAELVADAVRRHLGMPAQCPELGGLTGISAAAASMADAAPEIVVIISAGAVTAVQLDLLLRRTKRVFPQSAIAAAYWGSMELPGRRGDEHPDAIAVADTVESLLALLGRTADERALSGVANVSAKAG